MNNYYNDNNLHKTMTLTGLGQVSLVPNTAIIHLGVQTNGKNLVNIQSENAKITQSIIQALQRMGVSDVKTNQYTINKVYDYEDGKQIDRGYSVRNILEISTNNLESVGKIIDTSVSLGANVVDLISFDVLNKDYYYQQALNIAIMNAIQKSESIARNLGLSVNPTPTRIVENSSLPIPRPYRRELASETPILPGNISIDALVTIDFSY